MAYSFNGTTQYLSISSSPISGLPVTLSCWFYPNNITQNNALVSISNISSTDFIMINAAGAVAGDPLRSQRTSALGTVFADSSAYTANQWNHMAGVLYDFTAISYLNGAAFTATSAISTSLSLNAFTIGARRNNNSISGYSNGIIADVGIWNIALTSSEITSLSKGISCRLIRPQSLVFYAPLIRDLVDEKGGLIITNNNSTSVANHPRLYY